jgi:hypothetical protein
VENLARALDAVARAQKGAGQRRPRARAEAAAAEAAYRARLRARGDNQGRLDFRDGAGREIQILFSFRGFGQALDALARETGG